MGVELAVDKPGSDALFSWLRDRDFSECLPDTHRVHEAKPPGQGGLKKIGTRIAIDLTERSRWDHWAYWMVSRVRLYQKVFQAEIDRL